MPRQANMNRSVRITITTNARVEAYLKSLVKMGLYGSTVAEVARSLLCEKLSESLRRRQIALLDPKEEK